MRPHRKVEVWMGECHVHKDIKARSVNACRTAHPEAEVLVHPECACAGQLVYEMGMGDVDPEGVYIESTEGMVRRVKGSEAPSFIIATEAEIIHRLQREAPDKEFIPADRKALCGYMKTITLESVRDALVHDQHVVTVPQEIATRARAALDRMVQID
jgi:quinolinate synthase